LGKLKVFPPISGKGQGCPFSPLLFNIIQEVLAKVTKQEKDLVLSIEKPKNSTTECIELISEFIKVVGYIINIQKSLAEPGVIAHICNPRNVGHRGETIMGLRPA
jgi:hypothetical protein